jgi:zinc protease
VFQSRVNAINTMDFAAFRDTSASEIAAADAAAALRFYRERFSNAADFTFFFAGPFSVETITPLREKYVGSLPSVGSAHAVASLGTPSFPASVVRETVRKGKEPRSQVALTFFAPTGHEPVREELATAVAAILRTRVYDRLRGVMAATYTVNAAAARPAVGFGTIKVDFVCAPANVDALTHAAIEEAARLARDGPTAEEVASTRAARVDELKTRLTDASYWISLMETARRDGREAASIAADPAVVTAPLTREELAKAARQDLPASRYTVVTLLPEAP